MAKKAISNRAFLAKKFKYVELDEPWRSHLGNPVLAGSWIIWSKSNQGKTSYTLQLCKYLTKFARVAYNSLEQGESPSLQRAWKMVDMDEAGTRIILLEKETMSEVCERLRDRRGRPGVVVIDSVQYAVGWQITQYIKMREEFPNTLFIFISHARGMEPDGNLAQKIRYDADIKIRVEGFRAFAGTRYQTGTEGGKPYDIWPEGAAQYWLDKE